MNKEHEKFCPLSYLYPLLADHFHLLIPAAEGIQVYLQALSHPQKLVEVNNKIFILVKHVDT